MAIEMQLFVLHYTFNYILIVNLEYWFSANSYFLPTGYILGIAGDTVEGHRLSGLMLGSNGVEAKDAAKQTTKHKRACKTKNYPAQNARSAKVKKH